MKKAQGGLNAAILVAVIAAMIIIYILFLPAEDREKLLEEKSDYARDSTAKDDTLLLSENIGRLDPIGKVNDKTIANVYIFETTNSKVLDTINPIYVRNGWFDKNVKIVQFKVGDLQNTDNVFLAFTAPKRKGVLSIQLNGESIYEYDINTANIEPIKLKKSSLQEDNELLFSVSGVGAAFWKTNEYSLENVKIYGDITDLSRQQSQNVFSLSDTEYSNVEKVTLKFIPYCTTNVGVLDVLVNNRNIFSAVPVCNDRVVQDIPLSALTSGQNNVVFKTNKGSYSVEQIILSFKQKNVPESVMYFEVNSSTFKDIDARKYDTYLTIDFVDDSDTKRLDLNINDHLIRVDQEKKVFEREVGAWIEDGNNFIKITPKTTLEIVELNEIGRA